MIEIVESRTVVELDEIRTELVLQAPGPQGPAGPAGPAGPPGGELAYTHIQAIASDTWTIEHNLGTYVGGVQVVDSAGTAVVGDITYQDENVLVLTFASAFAGRSFLS